MSKAESIANFAVDTDGKEVPIRYKAAELVNHPAPTGYIWQRRNTYDEGAQEYINKIENEKDFGEGFNPESIRKWKDRIIAKQRKSLEGLKRDDPNKYHASDYYIAVTH